MPREPFINMVLSLLFRKLNYFHNMIDKMLFENKNIKE